MKKLFLFLFISMLFCTSSNAALSNYTKKIFDLTNPSGADQISQTQDISTKGGYSVYCVLTGTLEFDAVLNGSNQNDVPAASQTFTPIDNSSQHITNAGFIYDVTISNIAFVQMEIGSFTGTGTAKCYFTAKGY